MRKISRLSVLLATVIFSVSVFFTAKGITLQAADEEAITTEAAGEGVITGEVTSLDLSALLITVKTNDGLEKTFSVIDGETILWKGIEDIGFSDIKKGDEAEVGYYTEESGKLIASWVDISIGEEPVSSEAEKTGSEEKKKGSLKGSSH